ncbi:hypothetical protein [Methanosarcina sp. 2.H.A.1B.4]|jgi:hypothetical protein|uniref:hypothetical protein n=1 Tax=Methanosarcina sp. 2.H.A.1B.4 TaxID=1483600 RepID=UPI000621F54F|nr:hypothetical protein [Methanosarcina sp. 2.H.A.1B.4]KKG11106.1 hypothetical protein EO92_16920 [Methanosarcina sp. 2.H.A.1B.4]
MKTKRNIAICFGTLLILMGAFASTAAAEIVEVEMEVMPDMFVLSANSPWLELDVNDLGQEDYPSFEYLNDTGYADQLGLEITNIKISSASGEVFNDTAVYDRYEIKRSETTYEYVLAIMVARDDVNMNADFAEDNSELFEAGNLEFEVTGILTYPEIPGYAELQDLEFTATDSEVKVKFKGIMPENAGGNGKKSENPGGNGKHAKR